MQFPVLPDFEPGWVGKTLNIPYPGTFTAQDKAADTPPWPRRWW